MAKYSSVSILFEVDKADSGALTSGLTAYITKFGDLTVNKGMIDTTPFGASSATFVQGVFKTYEPLVIGGFYDDAAEPAPDAVFNIGKVTHAVTRTFSLTIGGAKTVGGELWITNYKRGFAVGEYTSWEATLQLTGVITEA